MKYAFQYAYDAGIYTSSFSISNTKMVEDTLAISLEEALELYSKYRDDFIQRLKKDERPTLAIWKDVGDAEFPIYSETLLDLDWRVDLKFSNGSFYQTTQTKIIEPI